MRPVMPQVPPTPLQGSRPLILISLCREQQDFIQNVEGRLDRFVCWVCLLFSTSLAENNLAAS